MRPHLFLPLLLLACHPSSGPTKPPAIILISLDTLRRDHVGIYSSESELSTPNLDAFAESAAVFENAFAPIPFTLPSHMSMLTGLNPGVHGVQSSKAKLAAPVAILPEILSHAGYRCIGLVTNLWMKGSFGFARGFDHYERLPYGLTYSDRLNRRLFELLDAEPDDDRPLFLFLHYVDAHSDFSRVAANTLPYYAPPEFLDQMDLARDSREFCDENDKCATDFLLAVNRGSRRLTATELEKLRTLYRGGVEYLDRDLGRLFKGLEVRGIWRDALVIVTADHGEEFLEHGELIHSQPYVEDLAVPLLIRLPGNRSAGSRPAAMVQLTDLLPTLLDWLDLPVPEALQGRSLLPMLRGDRVAPGLAFGRDKKLQERFALRTDRYTLIHDFSTGTSELYDRSSDPNELVDIGAAEPHTLDRLQGILQSLVEEDRRAASLLETAEEPAEQLTESEREKLKAIGYID